MKIKFKQLFEREQFYPSLLGLFINPFYFARKGLAENIHDFSPFVTGKILDVGCGSKPYQKLFNVSEYIGLEIDSEDNRKNKKADYFYQGDNFPFIDEEFDSVISNEVLEHIFNPDIFLSEVNRVLKPQGILLITVPFVWDEHEQPYDYARYSSFGLKHLLKKHGFKILEYRKSMNDIRIIFQLINAYLYKKTVTSNQYVNLITTISLMSPFNILGELLSKILPKNDDLYLDSIILAQKEKIYE
ncbi:class I SAM-dependent methyltransferase [Synechocystis sp. PCC 7339]|uniref:class I SAM-dependent methyltransferase n=1 Tax=Synechocystis sp. PCC 7339 TaxID=2782213 RepID=UPI001CC12DEF|nr:class I SAM-dependent methyltransferase [Synechocystis sp. PCC 7339]UAJ71503.1 class I SAM-dependent methyltransferase [Synechocystis sp. PCC 7339]